jgi:hypothetical protein
MGRSEVNDASVNLTPAVRYRMTAIPRPSYRHRALSIGRTYVWTIGHTRQRHTVHRGGAEQGIDYVIPNHLVPCRSCSPKCGMYIDYIERCFCSWRRSCRSASRSCRRASRSRCPPWSLSRNLRPPWSLSRSGGGHWRSCSRNSCGARLQLQLQLRLCSLLW